MYSVFDGLKIRKRREPPKISLQTTMLTALSIIKRIKIAAVPKNNPPRNPLIKLLKRSLRISDPS
ncbi:MAG: hypothetical protein ACTSX9_03475 [Candidatus Njordarchaeales archaeon]